MEPGKAITLIVIVVIAAIAVIASHGCYQYEETRREAIKAGLVEKVDNYGKTIWTKPDEK